MHMHRKTEFTIVVEDNTVSQLYGDPENESYLVALLYCYFNVVVMLVFCVFEIKDCSS